MTYTLDENILARLMTALDLEFEKAMHYHDEGCESDNDYGLSPQVIRPVHMYSVFTNEASFNLAEYEENTTHYLPLHAQMTQKLALP